MTQLRISNRSWADLERDLEIHDLLERQKSEFAALVREVQRRIGKEGATIEIHEIITIEED